MHPIQAPTFAYGVSRLFPLHLTDPSGPEDDEEEFEEDYEDEGDKDGEPDEELDVDEVEIENEGW